MVGEQILSVAAWHEEDKQRNQGWPYAIAQKRAGKRSDGRAHMVDQGDFLPFSLLHVLNLILELVEHWGHEGVCDFMMIGFVDK